MSFRAPLGQRLTLVICSGLIILLATMIAWGASVSPGGIWVNLVWLTVLAGCIALGLLILSEAAAAVRLRITLDVTDLHLELPPRRGHVQLPAVSELIPLARIRGVETRQEVFSQFGIVALQRAYRLLLKDGTAVELGADRQFKQPLFGQAAAAIAQRVGTGIRERGMVQGKPGVLAAWKTSVPDWSSPSLPDTLAGELIARSARTFGILAASVTLLSIMRILTRG